MRALTEGSNASATSKTESMRCRRLSSSHRNPIEVNDVTMTSSESQLLFLLQLHITFPKYIIIFLWTAHESPCLSHRLGSWSHCIHNFYEPLPSLKIDLYGLETLFRAISYVKEEIWKHSLGTLTIKGQNKRLHPRAPKLCTWTWIFNNNKGSIALKV